MSSGVTNSMGSVVELYEALACAPDERARARVIADAFEQLRGELRETELRLQKEIERSRNTLLMWIVPLMFAQVGALAALVKLL
jgi:hypothetical protein